MFNLNICILKTLSYYFLAFLVTALMVSCDSEDENDNSNNELLSRAIKLQNSTGATGCPSSQTVTFIVSYGVNDDQEDIQVDATISPGSVGFINVLIFDGGTINVRVLKTSDDTIIANTDFEVRTMRPDEESMDIRTITYCRAFDLTFSNF